MVCAPADAPAGCTGLLLAAGSGRRFDPSGRQHKLLQTLPDGRSLLQASAETLQTAGLARLIVLLPPAEHPHHAALQQCLQQVHTGSAASAAGTPLEVCLCPQAALGMGHSLAAGVAASMDATGWLIALADMPWLQPATVRQVSQTMLQQQRIARPSYQGQVGHPVAIPAQHRNALLTLSGDRGAQALLQAEGWIDVAVADAGVLRDVDQPEHLLRSGLD